MKCLAKGWILTSALAGIPLCAAPPALAAAGDAIERVLDLAAPQPLAFKDLASIRPVSAVARQAVALVADSSSGSLYLLDRRDGRTQRLQGVRVSADSKIAAGESGDWYVLNPTERAVYHLSPEGRVLEHSRDDVFLRATTDIAYDAARNEVIIGTRPVLSVDHVQRPTVGPWIKYLAARMGNWSLWYAHAVSSGLGKMFIIDSDRDVSIFDYRTKKGRTVRSPGLSAPTTLAVDRYSRIFVGQGKDLHVFSRDASLGSIDAPRLGVATISDLRIDDNLLTVTDTGAARVIAFEILPGL